MCSIAPLAGRAFSSRIEIAQLRKLLESLELEILRVIEESDRLHESPEFELYELTAKNAEMFEEIVCKQTALLEKEIVDLTNEAERLSKEIAALTHALCREKISRSS